MRKKILVVTPRSPFSKSGACDQDRACGIEELIRLGYDVRVIVKILSISDEDFVKKTSIDLGIKIIPVVYKFTKNLSTLKKIIKIFKRISNPLNWDGAAYEYKDKEIQNVFIKEIDDFQPDFVWFDYTYLWPLYRQAQKRKIPVITRSVNFEPVHFLQEDGFSFLNLIKFFPKLLSELIIIKKSDLIFSISPKEEKIYKKLGAKNVINLPLRGLPLVLKKEREIKDKNILNLFFMGSTYNVSHNRRALEFLIKEVAPKIEEKMPGKFIFHILGKKAPDELKKYFNDNVIYEGYVVDLNDFLNDMDIAVVPSLFGAGMQQKIFEPLANGIPTITSERGIADYPFEDGKHLLFAENLDEFVDAILKLQDIELRKKFSKNSLNFCNEIFSEKMTDDIVKEGLVSIIN
ncbi:glycosyltransferase family 4 protein [Candidatus Parcubacteria bacterium]|nr:glycosyltransferase family 4 protein [Candidatus Parcubacteria bacterium]